MTDLRLNAAMEYADTHFVRESPAMQQMRQAGEKLRPGMQMSAYEGALVAWLIARHGAKRILEIGTLAGISALTIGQKLASEATLITLEKDAEAAALARTHIAQYATPARIELVECNALEWLANYCGRPFDALVIDGEKKSYMQMLMAALPHLKKGTLILVDNSLLFGSMLGDLQVVNVSPAAFEAMQQLHATLADKTRFDSVLLPTPEGLIAAIKKF